jgi:ribonuclease HI
MENRFRMVWGQAESRLKGCSHQSLPDRALVQASESRYNQALCLPTLKVQLHWVLAHVGIVGNEAIGTHMKDVTLGSSFPSCPRSPSLSPPSP